MEKIKIQANLRTKTTKQKAGLRRQGLVPGVVYGHGSDYVIALSKDALKTLNSINFSESAIIDMEILGDEKKTPISVVIKDVQYHVLKETVNHIDFMKVNLDEKIRVNVPIKIKGEPVGLKDGGTLEQILREIEIETLPLNIPEFIVVDVSLLETGHSIHVKDVDIPEDVKVLTHLDETIAALISAKQEAAEEGSENLSVGSSEPEVIGEKKKEEKSDS
ncbi:MAG: 50S ribosomal protein L25 [Candidatus Gastranaerophilales bacterium]|nr:50S ribosomal protein L25 [Candidatus Gastranaerophilales bacterium]